MAPGQFLAPLGSVPVTAIHFPSPVLRFLSSKFQTFLSTTVQSGARSPNIEGGDTEAQHKLLLTPIGFQAPTVSQAV